MDGGERNNVTQQRNNGLNSIEVLSTVVWSWYGNVSSYAKCTCIDSNSQLFFALKRHAMKIYDFQDDEWMYMKIIIIRDK